MHSPAKESTTALTQSLPRVELRYFLKDGRRFHVGDCALFQAGNSPPFIGIICWFSPESLNYPKIGVNWLYRPCDVKLSRGTSIEAAPNEVFYSFHRDEISTESLLHPCKVAFLCKGVDLPSGMSSFVCWRVYDTTNKCLWWLTDKDYVDERQEEVNRLLESTQREIQVKPSCESMKGKNSELWSEFDRGDSTIKSKIAEITEKGALMNNDAVEKLILLMKLDRGERKFNEAERVLIAEVITSTEKNDCLSKFVQLSGVHVLGSWLQEAHKGKNGAEKALEELLLALLRALDKLPVNLTALQSCNIGKLVNRLRGHKNSEIRKKAKGLFDTWKKRVDVEIKKIKIGRPKGAKSTISGRGVHFKSQPSACQTPSSKSLSLNNGSNDFQAKAEPNSRKEEKSCSSGESHSSGQSSNKTDGTYPHNQRSRLLNPQRSPSHSASRDYLKESQPDSPVFSRKDALIDQRSKLDTDSSAVKAEESWPTHNMNADIGYNQSDRMPESFLDEEHNKNTDEAKKPVDLENDSTHVPREVNNSMLASREETVKSNSYSIFNEAKVKFDISVPSLLVNTENIVSKKHEQNEVKHLQVSISEFPATTSPVLSAAEKSIPTDADFDHKIIVPKVSDDENTSDSKVEATETIDGDEDEKTTDMEMKSQCTASNLENNSPKRAALETQLSSRQKVIVNEPGEIAAFELGFDLNEGLPAEEERGNPPTLSLFPNLPFDITVAAPAKGPFFPPKNLLRVKDEGGWKGSSATSAFCPAEPRRALEPCTADPKAVIKQSRPCLDIDLNVADEISLEAEEDLVSRKHISNVDFDMNLNRMEHAVGLSTSYQELYFTNGPGINTGVKELLPFCQNVKGSSEISSSSLQNGSSYPALTTPQFVPADQVNALGGQAACSFRLIEDLYRGPLMSSSWMPGQPFVSPFVINLPDGSRAEVSPTLGLQGIDLNARMEIDSRVAANRSALTSRQFHVNSGSTVLKRKEPEGGWDPDELTFRHPPWQ